FENSFDTIIAFLEAMNEFGIRPEHVCFDSGHVANLDPLIDMGLLSEPLQVSCVMGVTGGARPGVGERADMGVRVLSARLEVSCVMGVTGGIRPSARNLAHMAEQVPAVRHNWGVIGISRD